MRSSMFHRDLATVPQGYKSSGVDVDLACTADYIAATFKRPGTLASPWPKGAVAQLGERGVRNAEVRGSIPLRSTIQFLQFGRFHQLLQLARFCGQYRS